MDTLQLKTRLSEAVQLYIESFPRSYVRFGQDYGAPMSEIGRAFDIYVAAIRSNATAICENAAEGISIYLNLYQVTPRDEVDEFKYIFYVGQAIKNHLPQVKQIIGSHLFSMIGMLDFIIDEHGIVRKDTLTRAMMKIIREGAFDDELGATGCYLIYKCVSTTKRKPDQVATEEAPVKGKGLDTQRKSLAGQLLTDKA